MKCSKRGEVRFQHAWKYERDDNDDIYGEWAIEDACSEFDYRYVGQKYKLNIIYLRFQLKCW